MGRVFHPGGISRGIREGLYAGDIYTLEKRELLDTAVSKHAIGIDCSGFVSRCWKLERSYSTRELPSLCVPLASFSDLKLGDILNAHNDHVVIFRAFEDSSHQRILAYEAGAPPSWKVQLDSIPVTMLEQQGYKPYRYLKIVD